MPLKNTMIMKTIQLKDARIIEEIRDVLPEATDSEKGLLSSLYCNRIKPKTVLLPESQTIVRFERIHIDRWKSFIISVGPIYQAPSVYVVSMGFHKTSTSTNIIPRIINLSSSVKCEFFYRVSESGDFVDVFVKTPTTYTGVSIFNLIDSNPSHYVGLSLYTGDISELKSLGSI